MHGVKRMDSHPHLPYCEFKQKLRSFSVTVSEFEPEMCLIFFRRIDISGSQDGSIRMWEFGHAQEITSHRTSGSYQRVTRARFSPHGNKVYSGSVS